MRRITSSLTAAAIGAGLLCSGSAPVARAEAPAKRFEQFVASWMGVVAVIGSDASEEDEPRSFEIAAEEADEQGEGGRERERRDADSDWQGPRHHRGHGRHGERMHGGPGGRHHGPHHPDPHGEWMGPPRMGPPHGQGMQQHGMRAFYEILRRLAKIEEKLGIDDPLPSGPQGAGPRRPRPEMRPDRGPGDSAGPTMPRLDIPDDMRRMMEERMKEGRRRMEEAKERMEDARRRFRDMEEKIKQLEAEVERLKAAK
jgi:hypothetical protein